ncbi:MAG: sulfatase-like hydrolase/transferase [Saprospiraceae bacterium]|nr:sulfatase-like hydrolase/transferase [Saprospiraceae bacterium]
MHTPLDAKPEVVEKYGKKIAALGLLGKDDMANGSRVYQNLPEYAAMVQHMDENVGKVVAEIDALGLRDNTIIVFTSDNGGKHSVTSNAPLRGAKHNLYEGGIRVPTIIRYPNQVASGSTSKTPLISDDFYPTLLDLAGLPLQKKQHLDGRSFRKVLLSGSAKSIHDALFWHYPHSRFEGAVRWKNYKLVYEYKTGKSELYDLSLDLSEQADIAQQHPIIVNKMKKMLGKWLTNSGAKFPPEGIIRPG